MNVISAYAPQVGLSDDVKRRFWEDLEDMIKDVPNSSLEVILMVMLAQLEGGLRRYMGVLDMANRIKREKTS
jgi:hypothetical protein